LIDDLQYNTEREHLIIPEYGRHLQKMINYATTRETKEERNKVANAIISVMGNLQPHLRDVADFQHKLWDQLFIMSDFKLDADSPFEKPTKELLEERPEPLKYPQNHPKYRFYGNNIKTMIDTALTWEVFELSDGKINLKNSEEDLTDSASLMKSSGKKHSHNHKNYKKKNHKNNNKNRNRKRY